MKITVDVDDVFLRALEHLAEDAGEPDPKALALDIFYTALLEKHNKRFGEYFPQRKEVKE